MPAAQSPAVLQARGVAKSFGVRAALRDVALDAGAGELVAVIGPNGAGKTTLLSILAGILDPDAGEISLPHEQVGWVPQQPALYRRLSVAENLRLFARLERIPDPDAAVARMLALAGLEDRRDDESGTLSGGNQQRVNVAIGVLAQPRLLLLDEPTASLDPRQRALLWEFVTALADQGAAVVFSTHDVAEAERHAARILVLADGERLFLGPAAELRATVESETGTAAGDFESAFVAFLRHRGH